MLNVDKRLAEAKQRHREARESRQNARRDVRKAQWQVRVLAEKHQSLERRVKDKPTDKLMYEVMELEVELEEAKRNETRAKEGVEKLERNIEQLGRQVETIQRNLEALRRMEKIEAERQRQQKEKERQQQRMREDYAMAREESNREYSKRRKTNSNNFKPSGSHQKTTPPSYKNPTPSLAEINRKFLAEVCEWRKTTQIAFADYASMTTFPEPPSKHCRNKACAATANDRALKACRCNIEDAFRALPAVDMKAKKERTRWHPDKFSAAKVGEKELEVLRKKAQEVFVVLNDVADGLVYGKEPEE